MLQHHESKKFIGVKSKSAFIGIELHLKMLKYYKGLFKVGDVVLDSFALYQHIIDIYIHVPSNLSLEDLVHKPLIYQPYIFQAKGHDPIIKQTFVSGKSIFSSS